MKITGQGANKTVRWFGERVEECSASQIERASTGAIYRNLFLTGDESGIPQTFPKTNSFVKDESSFLYSPVDLRYGVEFYGSVSPANRAKGRAASVEMFKRMRRDGVDRKAKSAVTWSLIKGKSFIKLLWAGGGFQPHLIQPEYMGVMMESHGALDENMGCFVQNSYITEDQLRAMLKHHDKGERDDIMHKVQKYLNTGSEGSGPDKNNWLKQVVLGGLNPYQQAGQKGAGSQRGVVDWLNGPRPTFHPRVLARTLKLDELWYWDHEEDDWRTIQGIGNDVMITPKERIVNAFADDVNADPKNPDPNNPLRSKHPFIEFCPNELDGYFWGDPILRLVALLQVQLNKGIDGINHLLRMQENPPKFMKGISGQAQTIASRLSKPKGYFADTNPNADIKNMAPDLPQGLWERLHETEGMYDRLSGMRPVLRGEGEAGVRAQGHAETLTRNASPRFKDDAIEVEWSVEELGGLSLDILKAQHPDKITAWLMPGDKSIETEDAGDDPAEEAPAEGMKPIRFRLRDLDPNMKVVVSAHTSSPIFSHENRELLFTMRKEGDIDSEELINQLNPPGDDTMIANLEKKKVDQQKLMQSLPPEDRVKLLTGGKKR